MVGKASIQLSVRLSGLDIGCARIYLASIRITTG